MIRSSLSINLPPVTDLIILFTRTSYIRKWQPQALGAPSKLMHVRVMREFDGVDHDFNLCRVLCWDVYVHSAFLWRLFRGDLVPRCGGHLVTD